MTKIFAGGIATETNMFSVVPTGLEDFTIQRGGDAAIGRIVNESLDLSRSWGAMTRSAGASFTFGLMAWAEPSGLTTRAAYEALRDELLLELEAALPVDIVLLNLHGAMIADGYPSCEDDIIRRVRDLVGKNTVIGVELDLHCHLKESIVRNADIVVTYKEYPHTDVYDRALEVFRLALSTARGEVKPVMALFDCRMIGSYPTSRQPLRGVVDAMSVAEKRPGVLSISFVHGYRCADVPHMGAKVLVVADGNIALAQDVAREFGRRIYDVRSCIPFYAIALPMEQALGQAMRAKKSPVIVADQSDNPGSGAPGDSTFALEWVLERRAGNVGLGILHDPEVVKIARKAGIGSRVAVRLGGKTSASSGRPLDIHAIVHASRDNYVHQHPQQNGAPPRLYPLGDTVALRCGGVDIIVGTIRCQCFSPSVFADLGIDPLGKQALIVKSAQHFYSAFAPIAAEVIYMSAPGAASADPRHFPYRHLDTSRFYPWQEDPLGQC
jgi:microcystin degradation protein MlrC